MAFESCINFESCLASDDSGVIIIIVAARLKKEKKLAALAIQSFFRKHRTVGSLVMGGYYPACACAARGYVIGRGVYTFGTNILSPKILTFRGLFWLLVEFNGLWYSLAARQVFVAIANPIVCPLGKGLPTPGTQTLHQLQTTPLR